jgi:hypothetical protein
LKLTKSVDKKGQLGLENITPLIMTIGIIGVVAVVFILIFANLGANELLVNNTNASYVIEQTQDAIIQPFPLFGLAIVILMFIIIIGVVMMLRKQSQ